MIVIPQTKYQIKITKIVKTILKKPPNDLSVLLILDLNTNSLYESLEKFNPALIFFLVLKIIELYIKLQETFLRNIIII